MQLNERIILAAINAKWIHPSLALRLLKANLGKLEKHCRILEFALRQPLEEKVNAIYKAMLDTEPSFEAQALCHSHILGLSVYIWNHKATLELLKALHGKWQLSHPRPWVVLGGPEVSFLPPDSGIFRYADYVIRGEGEIAFRDLCEKLINKNDAETANLYVQPSGLPLNTNFIEAALPRLTDPVLVSAYDLYTEEDLEQKLIYVESSRGCVFHCDFCLSSTGNYIAGSKVREFPLELFLSDMDKLLLRLDAVSKRNYKQKQHTKTIKFLDRSFNINTDRALRIIKFFLDHINKNKNLCVHFEMVPFNIPPNMIDMLALFPPGSLRIELGIQTLDSQTSKTINRSANPDEVLDVLEKLRKQTSAIMHVDLIAGLPGENIVSFAKGFDRLWINMTKESFCSTQNRNCQTPFEIQPGILKLLPGTPMSRHTGSFGMVYDKEPPYEIIESSAVSEPEMQRIKNFARFWEILVNRNHFPHEISMHITHGKPVFWQFMELSDQLFKHFGCNWGIAREDLRNILKSINSA